MDSSYEYCRLNDLSEVEKEVTEVEEDPKYSYKITNLDAFWNTCSSIQGLGVLSMPLAASYGGWWFIISTIAVALISNYTAKILVRCLYRQHPILGYTRVRKTYADVGQAVWPTYGQYMVLVAKFLELLFQAASNPIACGEALHFLCPSIPVSTRTWILIFGLAMIPNICLNSVILLSKISMVTIVLGFGTFGTVIGYSVYQVPSWDIKDLLVFQPEKFPISLGLLVASYSAQIFLVVLEGSMRTPEKFNKVLNSGYVFMTLLKIALGVFGFLTFGRNVNEVVTNNLPTYFLVPINTIVIFLAFTGYSLPMFAVFDMMESSARSFLGKRCLDEYGQRPNTFCKYLIRINLVGITIVLATTIPHFSLILAFIGSLSCTSLALIFPCLFYIKLHWDEITWYELVLDAVIVVFGLLIAVSGLTYSTIDLLDVLSKN
ncbi:vesicular inhibitory amino acid transporter-like [Actinia tenebrosa]|uniref:Vesicular inhibitory amino acid transporter-like n=1 Tax=Actinia tenebrosa TaxID=6105 RepID=A0A6P8IHI8_ACTTE|nr:vesicular inhibitory amino acid transporter-like [Actinia tenebrosa]